MEFVTCGQMKILEKRADESGLSYYTMMENAGSLSAEIIVKQYTSPISDSTVIFFCGKGNNGGDGFVAARKLLEQGAKVTIVLVDGSPVTGDAKTNFDLIRSADVPILDMTQDPAALMKLQTHPNIIVDAIYGTGFHGELRPNALKAANYINQFLGEVPIFALDIPSGLGGDCLSEKHIDPNAVHADFTLTFHNKKPVHIKRFAQPYCGKIIIVDIGIDEEKLW